jgi:hypothetical protein
MKYAQTEEKLETYTKFIREMYKGGNVMIFTESLSHRNSSIT